ncbi:MAG: TadE family protein [Sandaracinaceae bacterium]
MIARGPIDPVHDRQGGAAYVEFLIAFLPLFTFFLGLVQWSLMSAADLVVQHAASRAVRAAIVVIDDEESRYDGADRLQIDSDGSAEVRDPLATILGLDCPTPLAGLGTPRGGPRLAAIRQAASFPLLAVSPSFDQLYETDSVRTALDDPGCRASMGAGAYNAAAMSVTFPDGPHSSSFRSSFAYGDQVTTRVTYAFHCGVPLINRLMCESYPALRYGDLGILVDNILRDLADGRIDHNTARQRMDRIQLSRDRHARDGDAAEELDSAASSELLNFTSLRGARYKLLQGEATMPLQAARYAYE